MSAPETNTEKKKPAHKTPIIGMIAVVVFALVLLFLFVAWVSYEGNNPVEEGGVEDGANIQPSGENLPATSDNSLPSQTEAESEAE